MLGFMHRIRVRLTRQLQGLTATTRSCAICCNEFAIITSMPEAGCNILCIITSRMFAESVDEVLCWFICFSSPLNECMKRNHQQRLAFKNFDLSRTHYALFHANFSFVVDFLLHSSVLFCMFWWREAFKDVKTLFNNSSYGEQLLKGFALNKL